MKVNREKQKGELAIEFRAAVPRHQDERKIAATNGTDDYIGVSGVALTAKIARRSLKMAVGSQGRDTQK